MDPPQGCCDVRQNFVQGMDQICSGILTLPAVATRVLHGPGGLGGRRERQAMRVCLPREFLEELTLLCVVLGSVGSIWYVRGSHSLGQALALCS